jgi:hypothetical protein
MSHDEDDHISVDNVSLMSIDGPENNDMDMSDDMDVDDVVEEMNERFEKLAISSDFFECFFGHVGIDEGGRAVRRSPRLGGALGSVFVPSNDGRTLRRSARLSKLRN